ncbi:hypothetical protein M2463_002266 [Parabacteroides sp. PH5-13]|uniref:RagB/SusD family nutrient uptake outer membrane protein n=1 Tax=unclassified Parabacteroides TaxID=2649774 RepID=UPI0024771E39|nr:MULTISPECIES: RagB/SusD family nutrient uptake outer membrane protein [unclassified Parabacteroides]MDH6316100.1 hypothetical protein [Parabacteroides sp. PF5-13]MDH6320250.1 hypothetical protein [Parabacteroides sp. PH5-13]
MKQLKYIAFALLLMGATTSCEDFLTVSSPDELTSDSFWRDKDDAEAGLAAAYSKLEASTDTWEFAEVKWPVEAYREDIVDLGSDALNYQNWVELANFTYTNGNSQFSAYWRDNYYGINFSNQVIENVAEIPAEGISEEDRAMIQNEAYFLRAYYHMKLLLNWERIVVRDTYISSADQLDKALSSREEAWDFIIGDLTKATALPATRTSEAMGRATRGAAYAFLGWAHLTRAYEGSSKDADLNAAVAALNNVTGYSLVKDFKSMFDGTNRNSSEGIFELQLTLNTDNGARYRTQLHRWIGVSELWGWDEILPSQRLMDEFKKEGKTATTGRYDSRLYETIFFKDDYFNDSDAARVYSHTYDYWFDGADKPAFRKYMPVDFEGLDMNYFAPNIVLMRYANVLLMKAEALNELGKTAEAIPLINEVRARADMPAMTGTSQEQVRAQIEHERIIEFPLENFRFYDLRRWGKTKAALDAVNRSTFDPAKHNFYPIPIQEVNTNNAID